MDSRDHERDDLGLPYSISYRATSANSAPVIDGRIPAPASQTLDRQQTPPPQYSDPDPFPAANATASNSRAPPQEAAHNHITIPTTAAVAAVRYRECQKNHAASSGGHVIDGCGEFMPGGEDGTPEALRCAACDCHRNFHRRESPVAEEHHHPNAFHGGGRHHHHHAATVFRNTPPLITLSHHHHAPPPQHNHHKLSHSSAPMMMAFGGAAAESSSEDLNVFGYTNSGSGGIQGHYSSGSRKRFRTKFSQNQKEKMQEFAEKLGWKIQKQDDTEVQQFCSEVGIKPRVFKVWMHNNKQAMKKKE